MLGRLLLLLLSQAETANLTLVGTPYGLVNGGSGNFSSTVWNVTSNRTVTTTQERYYWLRLPYAAPPTKDRRWRKPARAANWSGVRGALAYGPPCKQMGPAWPSLKKVKQSSEDCLTLNIFVPKAPSRQVRATAWW